MKKISLLLALALAPSVAGADVTPQQKATFENLVAQSCVQVRLAVPDFAGDCQITGFERRPLTAEVAEYSFRLPVGTGTFESIGIHRVVRETAPFEPVRTNSAVMFAHGDIWDFRAAFLAGERPLPVFLAENGVDVWGIDFRWTGVPLATGDFTFMKDWGIETDAGDLAVALGVARGVRLHTGNGLDKLLLLGWSRGGQTSYAYLNAETQLPAGHRQVRGFIPVDIYLKTDVPALQDAACFRYNDTVGKMGKGQYASDNGALISLIAALAAANPDGDSPIMEGLTNRQVSLVVGQATFLFFPPGKASTPFYHFNGGVFDANGLPAGTLYTPEAALLAFEATGSPFEPMKVVADGDAVTCGVNVAFDDHLAEIDVPVFYVGADGGFGHFGVYTTTLLGSTDVTSHVVDLLPAEAQIMEIGHADIFLGTDAESLFWQPILSWIQAH